MGSKLIWMAATLAYGMVCAAIFTFIRWRQGAKHHLRRLISSFCCFTLLGAAIVYVLWRLFSL
ncbi:MAG: hypothetical protein NC301_04130 [Bacteroides sp.]|nr:hypothetical protein [Bacteroides sp.]MCM1379487.1 hypothetical protein [Bacteroides sp.]MCM1445910.1 hypothetical protein [Prevotella sp.]